MATSKLVGYAVKYGVKYGPHLVVAAKALKEPATAYAQKVLAAQRAKKAALAEAATLQAGTVLKVFHQGQEVWVVYSGEDALRAHPEVPGVSLATLVERADLSQRMRPSEVPDAKAQVTGAAQQALTKATSLAKRKH